MKKVFYVLLAVLFVPLFALSIKSYNVKAETIRFSEDTQVNNYYEDYHGHERHMYVYESSKKDVPAMEGKAAVTIWVGKDSKMDDEGHFIWLRGIRKSDGSDVIIALAHDISGNSFCYGVADKNGNPVTTKFVEGQGMQVSHPIYVDLSSYSKIYTQRKGTKYIKPLGTSEDKNSCGCYITYTPRTHTHTYTLVSVSPATCTEYGKYVYECSCGDKSAITTTYNLAYNCTSNNGHTTGQVIEDKRAHDVMYHVTSTEYFTKCLNCDKILSIRGSFKSPASITVKYGDNTFDSTANPANGVTYRWKYYKDNKWADIPETDKRFSGITTGKLTFNAEYYDPSITYVSCNHTIGGETGIGDNAKLIWDISAFAPAFTGNLTSVDITIRKKRHLQRITVGVSGGE